MARRRREEKEPDLPFDVPEFDEEEFIRKEWVSFRATLVVLGYALLAALITYVVWLGVLRGGRVPLLTTLLVAVAVGYGLRWALPRAKIDISHYGKKEWFGTGAIYLFSWLAFFIFILNPPFQDTTPPQAIVNVVPNVQEPGGTVVIALNLTDNREVDAGTINFDVQGPASLSRSLEELGSGHWRWKHTFEQGEEGTYTWSLTAADTADNSVSASGTFNISTSALAVSPQGGMRAAADRVIVQLAEPLEFVRAAKGEGGRETRTGPAAVWRVYFTSEQAPGEHPLRYDSQEAVWFTSPRHDGWEEGNNTLRFHVETHATYLTQASEGVLTDSSVHEYTVAPDDLVGTEDIETPDRLPSLVQPTPLGLWTVLLALLAVAFGRRLGHE